MELSLRYSFPSCRPTVKIYVGDWQLWPPSNLAISRPLRRSRWATPTRLRSSTPTGATG